VIGELIDQMLQKMKIALTAITYAHLGLSGADLPIDLERLTNATKPILKDIPFTIENDAWLILRSGLHDPYGAVCICGTGTNAAAINREGKQAILRSLGFTLGIYGRGLDIAREALHYAFRAEELTYKKTALMDAIPPLLGVSSMADVIPLFYPQPKLDRQKMGEITALTFKLAHQGDEVCQEIIKKIAMFLGYQTAGVIKQVGEQKNNIPVVIGGRVFEEGGQLLIDHMLKYLKEEVPQAYLVRPIYPPMIGGYLRALDHLNIIQSEQLEWNLKEMRIKR
jgi:N-acetylglucosamine kinase-like BadF-type ATPase